MASINDVNNAINKVNTSINKVLTSVNNEITSTNNVTTSVNTLDADVKSGFAETVAGLNTLAQIGVVEAQLLFHLTQQADTMICALNQISRNTCGILTQVTLQTQLQKRLVDDSNVIRDIEQSAHPEAARMIHEFADLRSKIEKCCPTPQPEPACTYVPCPSPKQIGMPSLPDLGGATTGNKPT
jgi:hypothetical protein